MWTRVLAVTVERPNIQPGKIITFGSKKELAATANTPPRVDFSKAKLLWEGQTDVAPTSGGLVQLGQKLHQVVVVMLDLDKTDDERDPPYMNVFVLG